MPEWLDQFAPILILLVVVAIVIARLPRVKGLGYTDAYRVRRVRNWLPLGLTYAFLYMGRYNLTVAKNALDDLGLMDNADFGYIFGAGTLVYGFSFLINGPLTDRYGGKAAILVGAAGALICNALLGLVTLAITAQDVDPEGALIAHRRLIFSVVYSANMYFQSFGAVAIVKCNAPWFHVRERGVFGAIFGILISLGIYFAFDWGQMIVDSPALDLPMVFFIPAALLGVFGAIVALQVKNTPGEAGHPDFQTGDASDGDEGPQLGAVQVFKRMLTNPVIMTIAGIEFCSGFLRQAIMQWYRAFAKQTDAALGFKESFVYENWGMLLCCAGILGGVLAGVISDRVFGSRRGPVAAVLYGAMLVGAVVMCLVYQHPVLGLLVIAMSMCVIGVHGMLSGTASMDFGGRKNAGIAVGIIDGFVYAGTGVMSLTYANILPREAPANADPGNWLAWPLAMVPVALIGLLLATRIWNAKPKPRAQPAPVESEE